MTEEAENRSVGPVSGTPNKGGRPRKLAADESTLHQLKRLGKIQATVREGAAFFDVAVSTFEAFLNEPGVREAFDAGKGMGTMSLRRAQFAAALKGNATMLIFLGKNLLGQKDQNELAVSGSLDVGGAKARLDAKLAPALGVAAAGRPKVDPQRFDA